MNLDCRENNGFALVGALIFLGVLVTLHAGLQLQLLRSAHLAKVESAKQRQVFDSGRSLVKALRSLEHETTLEPELLEGKELDQILFDDLPTPWLHFSTQSVNNAIHANRTASVILLGERGSGISKPDWSGLYRNFHSTSTKCSSWRLVQENQLDNSSLLAPFTCFEFKKKQTDNIYIAGNLFLKSPLLFKGLSKQTQYFVVQGSATLRKGINVSNTSQSTIVILALADIEVGKISWDSDASFELLLHSSGGGIKLENKIDRKFLCQGIKGEEPESKVSILLESTEGISLDKDSKQEDLPKSVGCNIAKADLLWPKFKLFSSTK